MLTSNVLAAYIGTVSYHGNIYPTMHDFNLLYRMFGEAIKKKATKLDIVQTSADPPPRQLWTQKVWMLRLGSYVLKHVDQFKTKKLLSEIHTFILK